MSSLASRIYACAHLTGTFTLRSGQHSDQYFDKYQFESDPALLEEICQAAAPLVPRGTELLAGLEMGGIPVVTMLSHITGIPALFVRKEAKTYGTSRLAEGPQYQGRQLLIVEDVVTTGGQIILSTAALRDAGANVEHALCVVDRESGGREKLAAAGIQLSSVCTYSDLVAGSD